MAENLWPAGEEFARGAAVEVVGLGFRLRHPVSPPDPFAAFDPPIRFVTLVNEAERTIDEFYVSGSQVHGVLSALQGQFGEGNVQLVCLWHSHFSLAGPSVFDLANFPEWMVGYGAIYHVPTNTTYLYNKNGILTPEDVVDLPARL